MSRTGSWVGVMGVLSLLLAGTSARAEPTYPGGVGPARVVTSDGHVWERIPMRYVDPRYVAMILGGRALPTEMDVFLMRSRGMVGGMGGGYSGGNWSVVYPGVRASGAGGYLAQRAGPGMAGSPYGVPGMRVYGDPNTNSLLVGPGGFGAGVSGAGAGQPGGGRSLIPGLLIFGDPNTNSLLVDP